METILAILTGLGVGASLTMVLFKPKRNSPQWPELFQHDPPTLLLSEDKGNSIGDILKNIK